MMPPSLLAKFKYNDPPPPPWKPQKLNPDPSPLHFYIILSECIIFVHYGTFIHLLAWPACVSELQF